MYRFRVVQRRQDNKVLRIMDLFADCCMEMLCCPTNSRDFDFDTEYATAADLGSSSYKAIHELSPTVISDFSLTTPQIQSRPETTSQPSPSNYGCQSDTSVDDRVLNTVVRPKIMVSANDGRRGSDACSGSSQSPRQFSSSSTSARLSDVDDNYNHRNHDIFNNEYDEDEPYEEPSSFPGGRRSGLYPPKSSHHPSIHSPSPSSRIISMSSSPCGAGACSGSYQPPKQFLSSSTSPRLSDVDDNLVELFHNYNHGNNKDNNEYDEDEPYDDVGEPGSFPGGRRSGLSLAKSSKHPGIHSPPPSSRISSRSSSPCSPDVDDNPVELFHHQHDVFSFCDDEEKPHEDVKVEPASFAAGRRSGLSPAKSSQHPGIHSPSPSSRISSSWFSILARRLSTLSTRVDVFEKTLYSVKSCILLTAKYNNGLVHEMIDYT